MKVPTTQQYFRWCENPPGNFTIGGQADGRYGNFNFDEVVRKEMLINAIWWNKGNPSLYIHVDEYQVYDLSSLKGNKCFKRKFLCRTTFYFFDDEDQDFISKCQVTVKDDLKRIYFNKTYNQVDRVNRRFYTTR